jgi:23S rRNA (pseudouridine1915-N3)-methyltransferase
MVNITVICPGKMDSQFKPLFDEYKKRCKNDINLKEFVIKENDSKRRIEAESHYILNQLQNFNSKFVILLDIEGRLTSSNDLAELIVKSQNDSVKNLVFIIGGAFGVNEEIKKLVNLKISFGKNTWPHNLMKVMLMEQIFRAETIIDGRDYHH